MTEGIIIDFFELELLIETCWYSGTILRHSVMQKAINYWYRHLTENERARIYEFFLRTKGDEITMEIQKRFMARYNPNNQFLIETCFEGKKEELRAYLFNGKYWIDENTRIEENYITNAKIIKYP